MKSALILAGIALVGLGVWLTLMPSAAAAQQPGDSFTVLVPEGTLTDMRKVLVVTGKPKTSAAKVGNCKPGAELSFSEGNIVDRDAKEAPVVTEAAIVYPGASGISELKVNWRLGSFRAGGKCGPGYEAFVAHILALQ